MRILQAFQNLMNLHILFCPPTEGTTLPTSVLAISLDDQAQYRCAGFVQAEIERYADELEDLAPDAEEEGSQDGGSDAEDSENDAGPSKRKKSKKAKGKKPAGILGKGSPSSSSRLEREYAFMNVIATFLRAIRVGAIHYRHVTTLLAHHGRLGPVYDSCSKVVVEILREEGMYNEHGAAVVDVIFQSLRDVSVHALSSAHFLSDKSPYASLSPSHYTSMVSLPPKSILSHSPKPSPRVL